MYNTIRHISEIKQIYCNKLRYFVLWKIQEIVVENPKLIL